MEGKKGGSNCCKPGIRGWSHGSQQQWGVRETIGLYETRRYDITPARLTDRWDVACASKGQVRNDSTGFDLNTRGCHCLHWRKADFGWGMKFWALQEEMKNWQLQMQILNSGEGPLCIKIVSKRNGVFNMTTSSLLHLDTGDLYWKTNCILYFSFCL